MHALQNHDTDCNKNSLALPQNGTTKVYLHAFVLHESYDKKYNFAIQRLFIYCNMILKVLKA